MGLEGAASESDDRWWGSSFLLDPGALADLLFVEEAITELMGFSPDPSNDEDADVLIAVVPRIVNRVLKLRLWLEDKATESFTEDQSIPVHGMEE